MKQFICILASAAFAFQANAITTVLSTNTEADFTGTAYNWENVAVSNIDNSGGRLTADWSGGPNYTVGVAWMSNLTFNLAGTLNGIENLTVSYDPANDSAGGLNNWSLIISVNDTSETRFYRWNHSGNNWNGTGVADFTIGGSFPDLSAPNIFGRVVGSAANWGGTRIDAEHVDSFITPDGLKTGGADAEIGFGFIQWGASTGGSVNTSTDIGVDAYTVTIDFTPIPEPTASLFVLFGGLVFLRRRR